MSEKGHVRRRNTGNGIGIGRTVIRAGVTAVLAASICTAGAGGDVPGAAAAVAVTAPQSLPPAGGSVVSVAVGANAKFWALTSTGTIVGTAAVDPGFSGLPHKYAPVAIAAAPDGTGFWEATLGGEVLADATAGKYGSLSIPLVAPITGLASTPDGKGYWLVAADGGVFAFGDAGFFGSAAGLSLVAPIDGIAPTPDGKGYWLVASDGGVFNYTVDGTDFFGSLGGLNTTAPVVALASDMSGANPGYWLVTADGGIYAFGAAPFLGTPIGYLGNPAGSAPNSIVGMQATSDGGGYWLFGSDGSLYPRSGDDEGGNATILGSVS